MYTTRLFERISSLKFIFHTRACIEALRMRIGVLKEDKEMLLMQLGIVSARSLIEVSNLSLYYLTRYALWLTHSFMAATLENKHTLCFLAL